MEWPAEVVGPHIGLSYRLWAPTTWAGHPTQKEEFP